MKFTGGVLLSLLLEIKYESPRATRLSGNKEGCSNPEFLKKLIDLIGLEITKTPSPQVTSRFKNCEANGAGNDINTKKVRECFDKRIKTEYGRLHRQVKKILEEDIVEDDKGRRNITTILLALVKQCDNISPGTLLYTNESGKPETPEKLQNRNVINLPALILGLWHFTVSSVIDNRDGATVFDSLFINKGVSGTDYELKEEVRKMQRPNLKLTYDDSTAEDTDFDEEELCGVSQDENKLRVENPGKPAQAINFNFTVNGDNANVRNIINNGIYIEGDYNEK